MSVNSCTAFLERTQREPDLRRLLRSTTDTVELIALARKHGYTFDINDLMSASSAFPAQHKAPPVPAQTPQAAAGTAETTICHYEFDLHECPELRPVLAELPNLKIKPPTVDLDLFHAAFRREDLEWTSMSPAAPEFADRYQDVMATHRTGREQPVFGRRDCYLVNLDQHVDHPLYEQYFEAKTRTIQHLEQYFGPEVQFSGSLWYPPSAYRLWHTNENQPGWRMYVIDFDEETPPSDTRSFFRYMNPHTKEIVTLPDRPRMCRLFKVDQHKDRLLWHCIVNASDHNRWSFGFVVPDDWMARLTIPKNQSR